MIYIIKYKPTYMTYPVASPCVPPQFSIKIYTIKSMRCNPADYGIDL